MKIEIELEELEWLRSDLKKAKEENERLNNQLKALDEKQLKEHAVNYSFRLFNNYMACVFDKLGFQESWDRTSVAIDLSKWDNIGESWWNAKRVQVEISATVYNNFRQAFLRIFLLPKEQVIEEIEDYKQNT